MANEALLGRITHGKTQKPKSLNSIHKLNSIRNDIGVAASGSAVGKLNMCAQQHYCCCFFKCLVLCTLFIA